MCKSAIRHHHQSMPPWSSTLRLHPIRNSSNGETATTRWSMLVVKLQLRIAAAVPLLLSSLDLNLAYLGGGGCCGGVGRRRREGALSSPERWSMLVVKLRRQTTTLILRKKTAAAKLI
ncbi:hypothetical protein RHMOL_Rhmol12G0095300 [Rhododendron molle]|uniref:Uncharacterized protein n=1 Tax=Rhododendron molle TaxID=49168 RepID=A0ACC0LGP3_RHOML|nr:hypothetical protein RHMOL_Rhmol12G0095300 [Rhododendron molle]